MTAWTSRLTRSARAHPLIVALACGVVTRAAAVTAGFGFHARDDYFHVLVPAARWLADPDFDWDHSTLPGAGIRSHLVPRAVWLALRAIAALGIDEPTASLRCVYALFGAFSLLVIPALFFAARRLMNEQAAALAALLGAAHFIMPYAGTRMLIEAAAMVPLASGVYFASDAKARRLLLAGVLVGAACWLRFQVGAAAIGMAIAIGWRGWQRQRARAAALDVCCFGVGGALTVAAQGLFDLWTTGVFLGPVLANLAANLSPPAGLTESSLWSYPAFWLLLTMPPASLLVVPLLCWSAWRRPLLAWPLLVFVAAHSLVPHKEERFMLPVMPLFLLLLADVPTACRALHERWGAAARRWWPLTARWLVGLHALALVVAVTYRGQANIREAMDHLRHDARARAIVSLGPELQLYFLQRPEISYRQRSQPAFGWLERAVDSLAPAGVSGLRFVGFAVDEAPIEAMLMTLGLDCEQALRADGAWLDRLAFRLNARHNRRRAPIVIWRCSQPAFAAVTNNREVRPASQAVCLRSAAAYTPSGH